MTAAARTLALAFFAAFSVVVDAASFDCTRARSKLNRVICSDAELSRLDETVWNTYGERIRSLTPLQFVHVRERHLMWRRGRGLYETTVEALTHEYRSHLAWLTHPLLGIEGRYQRAGINASMANFEAEIDLRSPAALQLRGRVMTPVALAWQASAHGESHAGSVPGALVPGQVATVRTRPLLPGNDAAQLEACEFDIAFEGDDAVLTATDACGKAFDGRYSRTPRD